MITCVLRACAEPRSHVDTRSERLCVLEGTRTLRHELQPTE